MKPLIECFDDDSAQGMVEYLLIVSMVVLTIAALFAGLVHASGK